MNLHQTQFSNTRQRTGNAHFKNSQNIMCMNAHNNCVQNNIFKLYKVLKVGMNIQYSLHNYIGFEGVEINSIKNPCHTFI